jgi:CspA family cold shock protein
MYVVVDPHPLGVIRCTKKHECWNVEDESGFFAPLLTSFISSREVFSLENGTVKSFDDAKGQGWIAPAEGMKDLFVHQRSILDNDVRTLPVDAKVTYESRTNEQGLEAINVSLSK